MAQYCDNFTFQDNDNDSFEFWNGLRGPAGPAGAPGAPGTSVELRGPVASTSLLPESASSSELWMVGAESPYTGYFWNGSAWIDLGAILQGPQGESGEDGVSPEIEIETITGGHTVTITDAEHPSGQSFNVMDGADGAPGQPGTPGAPGAAAGFGAATATVDANVGTPSVDISSSGPDTAKVFSFAFHNLKGEPGSGGGGPDPYTSDPADLAAAASPGSASQYSRGDHVHKLPTAAQIGAYVKPSGGIPASDLAAGVIPSVPSASSASPAMDGTASPGSSGSWARGDHVHPSDTGKQDKITASGILKGDGSGGVSAATLGTDYGNFAFTVTLTAAGWSGNAQAVSNANFIASGFAYIVTPAGTSIKNYGAAEIYADNVTVAGQMTFHCTTVPSSDLTVNILRGVSA